ncbi:MAG TPA: hypothetical protein VH969_13090 [Actinophytocola sp.]|jgi:hypothetical protein|uniref:hypothetical protein n=1 Tax=Actinophytocola sp. TaxID=1872138 RepID=UPI002F934818
MDSARQALRWSIPGLIFVLELVAFAAVWRLTSGDDPTDIIDGIGPTTALATILAGIPLGFLLYQLYYRNYRPYGRSVLLFLRYPLEIRHGLRQARPYWSFVRRDRGADILRRYYQLGGHPNLVRRAWHEDPVPDREDAARIRDVTAARTLFPNTRPSSFKVLTLDEPLHAGCSAEEPAVCQKCRYEYAKRFRWNWAVIMALLDYAGNRPDGAAIKLEYAAGSDIYHALGAARTAIATAAIGSIGYRLTFHILFGPPVHVGHLVQFVVGGSLIALLAYAQYQVIHSAREQASTNLTIRTAAALCWFSHLAAVRNGRDLSRPGGAAKRAGSGNGNGAADRRSQRAGG